MQQTVIRVMVLFLFQWRLFHLMCADVLLCNSECKLR